MTADEIAAALKLVREESDLNSKSLLLAGLVSELFRERGFEPVVVGGSAIEFYTDGAYMSGDTDICWTGWPQPNNEERIEIMRQLPGVKSHGGGKSWGIEGLWIDLLGEIDYRADKDCVRVFTPFGQVVLIPVEDALVGRVYAARSIATATMKKTMTVPKSSWQECSQVAFPSTGTKPTAWQPVQNTTACRNSMP